MALDEELADEVHVVEDLERTCLQAVPFRLVAAQRRGVDQAAADPTPSQLVGSGEPRRAGAYDQDLLFGVSDGTSLGPDADTTAERALRRTSDTRP
jgi:hypothetical protein